MSIGFLAQLTGIHRFNETTKTFYLSDFDFATRPDDPLLPSTEFLTCIDQPLDINRAIFAAGKTVGESDVSTGELILDNTSKELFGMMDYSFDGFPCVFRSGETTGKFLSDFPITLNGEASTPSFGPTDIRIGVRDLTASLANKLPMDFYLGNNVLPDGVEGGPELKGKPKYRLFGYCNNATPICVNSSKNIYQLCSGPTTQVFRVLSAGTELLYNGSYATYADLMDDAQQPAFGYYKVYAPLSLYRTRVPAPNLTISASSDNFLTHAGFINTLWLEAGYNDNTKRSLADIQQLDIDCPGYIGKLVTEETSYKDLLNEATSSIDAAWWAAENGVLRIRQMAIPVGTPVAKFNPDNIVGDPLNEKTTDPERGAPVWRVRMQYNRNLTVQKLDLDTSADYATRVALGIEWEESIKEIAHIRIIYKNAPDITIPTLFRFQADADRECLKRLTFRSVMRFRFICTTLYEDEFINLDIGSIVSLQSPDYQLNLEGSDTGPVFLLIGKQPDSRNLEIQWVLWGSDLSDRNIVTEDDLFLVTEDGTFLVTGGN